MKRILFVLSVLLVSAVTASAQDIITKKNGEDIKAKVLEIDNSNVKYKLFDEPDGVTYTMPKTQILMIRYESGRNEVFNTAPATINYGDDREPAEGIRYGMKYRELKHIYNYKDWYSGPGDSYNPAVMGVCSWLIPGLGQMICGEVGRGFGWLAGAAGSSVLLGVASGMASKAMYEAEYIEDSDYETTNAIGMAFLLAGVISYITIDICAIKDACRVAKVRNMYEQDLRKMNYSLELHPSVDYIRMPNGSQPIAGLTLAMRF